MCCSTVHNFYLDAIVLSSASNSSRSLLPAWRTLDRRGTGALFIFISDHVQWLAPQIVSVYVSQEVSLAFVMILMMKNCKRTVIDASYDTKTANLASTPFSLIFCPSKKNKSAIKHNKLQLIN